ncbi:MAG: tRNA (adenosine(37)-N6)-threonylcarbamoyltransferase complex ATPase subunit type 1 TsaE [Fuerstiella sp.]|nr:tRNA (adenosine(37)-N6)-threonylcarbamoyltransferase complex ATPase subunit type 1 TsaE [Fuerstiella sp.]
MSHITFHSESEAQTHNFAAVCATSVSVGLTIALNGQLGSGKTYFVRSFCRHLGIDPSIITSPTFVLQQVYECPEWTVSHFDTYRLADHDEFLALGAEDDLFDPQRICFVEWAERITEILPKDHLLVEIRQSGPTARRFDLISRGPVSDNIVNKVRGKLTGEQALRSVHGHTKPPGGQLSGD